MGIDKGHVYTLRLLAALGPCLRPPTVELDQRVTGLLGLVSTAEKGTEEEEKMQDEKDRGKGKFPSLGTQALER